VGSDVAVRAHPVEGAGTRRTVLVLLVLPATVLVVASASAALSKSTSIPTLKGTVGPGFTISLKPERQAGEVPQGRHVHVRDRRQSEHPQLRDRAEDGRKVREKDLTSVSFVGTKTAKVTLTPGQLEVLLQPA
jgi:hypothetical protein